jgi:hypothetical protein
LNTGTTSAAKHRGDQQSTHARQEFKMHSFGTLIASSVVTLATACASPGSSTAPSPATGMAPKAGVGDGKGMPTGMAKRHQKVMDTMADRMPPAAMSK